MQRECCQNLPITYSITKPESIPPQVDMEDRLEREAKFRSEKGKFPELPLMFCSPTMELGVDISSLNTVYMRNVPPTPA